MNGRTHPDVWPLTGRRRRRAFTLLEVVLALAISLGLLAVVLHFYQQIARLRDETLIDTSELASVRLFLDRLAGELRTVAPRAGTFVGTSRTLEFVRADLPRPTRGGSNAAPAAANGTALAHRRVRYQFFETNELSAGASPSVVRSEENLASFSESTLPNGAGPEANDPAGSFSMPLGTSNVVDSGFGLGFGVTNTLEPATRPDSELVSGTRGPALPQLRYLAFRYTDGRSWVERWDASELPRGVEIRLATSPAPTTEAGAAFPRELFRRVVALPTAPWLTNVVINPVEDFGL